MDGTYGQTFADGSTQGGTYVVREVDGREAVILSSGALAPVYGVGHCPFVP